MTAIEDRLRDLRRSVSPPDLPAADQVAQQGQRRRRQRRAVRTLGLLAILAVVPLVVVRLSGDGYDGRVVSGGGAHAPTTSSSTTSSSSTQPTEAPALPSFRPAPGWHTSERGTGGMLVTAANVPLGPDALEGNYPAWGSIGRLQEGEILMQASFMAPLESWADDTARGYPPRSLPLSLDEAPSNYGFEGQPDHVYTERVGATVNGWNIDVLISYGGGDPTAVPPVRAQPNAGTRAAAQEQLARLVVPLPPARSG